MNSKLLAGISIVLICNASLAANTPALSAPSGAGHSFNVRNFGAVGNGQTKDTAAFQKALDACAKAGGGRVVVPSGDYLIGSIVLHSNTTLELRSRACLSGSPDIADYPLVQVRWEGEFRPGHRALICANKANNIAIVGRGAIFGPPLRLSRLRHPRGPVLIEITDATNVLLEGFTTQYQRLWSIHPLFCHNLTARNLTIRSVLPNGDGIDVDSCSDVTIERCNIDTGDDAVALKSGRGLAAERLNRPTQNVVIRDCSLVSSTFAGLAMGTEMSGGIRNVTVENCLISGRQNGIFMKSRHGRGGYFENITGEDLTIRHSPTFVGINLVNKGIQASDPVPGKIAQWSLMKNVRFENIKVDHVRHLVEANEIPAARPVEGLTLANISGTCSRGIVLSNMKGVTLSGIDVTGFEGPLLRLHNVTGSGLKHPSSLSPSVSSK